MGKKMADEEKMVFVGLRMHRKDVERLNRLACKADMEPSRLIRNMVELQLDALERVDKVGIYSMSILLRDVAETLTDWAQQVKNEPDFPLRAQGLLRA